MLYIFTGFSLPLYMCLLSFFSSPGFLSEFYLDTTIPNIYVPLGSSPDLFFRVRWLWLTLSCSQIGAILTALSNRLKCSTPFSGPRVGPCNASWQMRTQVQSFALPTMAGALSPALSTVCNNVFVLPSHCSVISRLASPCRRRGRGGGGRLREDFHTSHANLPTLLSLKFVAEK